MPKIKAPRRYKYVVNRVNSNTVTTTSKEKSSPPVMASSPPPAPPASTKATPAVEKEQPRPVVPRFSFSSLISGIENKAPPGIAQKPNVGPLSPPSSNDRATPKGPLSPPRDKTTSRPIAGPSAPKCKVNPLSPRTKTPPLVSKRSLGEAAAKIVKSKTIGASKAKSPTTTIKISKKKTDGSGCNNSTAITSSTTKSAATAIKAAAATTATSIKINIKARKYTSNESSPTTISTTTTTAATTPNNDIKTKKSTSSGRPPNTTATPTATDINIKAKGSSTSNNSATTAAAASTTGITIKARKASSSLTAAIPAAKNTTSMATITDNATSSKVLAKGVKRNRASGVNKIIHVDDLPSPVPKTGTNKRPRSPDIIEIVDLESLPLPSFKKVRTQPSAPSKPAVPRLNIKPLKQRPTSPNPLRVDMPTTPRPAMAHPLRIPDFAKPRGEAGVARGAGEPYLGPLSERFGTSMRDMMGPQWAIAPEGAASKQYWREGAR